MKDKPETTPWFKYYIFDPLSDLGKELVDAISKLYDKLTRRWYCEYCGKYHSRRVHKYTINFPTGLLFLGKAYLLHIGTDHTDNRKVCSLAAQAYEENKWTPERYRK